MSLQYSPKNNPRVIVIQKLYGKFFNKDEDLTFPKHRFKKFIKDVVNGTIEREDIINEEIKNHLNSDVKFHHRNETIQGTFLEIDNMGQAILNINGIRQEFSSGIVEPS